MCGIAGIIGEVRSPEVTLAIGAMHNALAHRGPDGEGIFRADHAVLLHRRLAIIDLSKKADEPMTDPSGRYTIVFNGEVYNFREIRSSIPDYDFQTQNDAEVALASFMKWGAECLHRFQGMFAFAIWDEANQVLFACRDRIGIKPLYTFQNDRLFAFASEIRPLLKSGLVSRNIEIPALNQFLAWQTVFAPNTIIRDVKTLLPGHWLKISNGKMEIHRWWDPGKFFDSGKHQGEKPVKAVRTLLQNAVRKRMFSDVPVGAFLSGGMDSSAVVALMAQQSNQPIDTFSVVFKEKEYDESKWSTLISGKYKTRHHPLFLTPDSLPALIPGILESMDHPTGDGINSWVISELAHREGIKVALSGLGGDELFGGYPVFRQLPGIVSNRAYWSLPKAIRNWIPALWNGRRREKLEALSKIRSRDLRSVYPVFRMVFGPSHRAALLNRFADPFPGFPDVISTLDPASPNRYWSLISAMEILTYTQHVLLRDADQMSMSHALEVRVPFFDHELVEYLLGLPDEWKMGNSQKSLLAAAMKNELPEELLNRTKAGFVFPWNQWLRNELRPFAESRINSLAKRELLHSQEVMQTWNRFISGDSRILWVHVWLLVVLEDWMQKNLGEG